MLWLYCISGRWTGGADFRKKIRRDIAEDKAAVHSLEVVDSIRVLEREDEGPTYFLLTTDNVTLVFSGQYLLDYENNILHHNQPPFYLI